MQRDEVVRSESLNRVPCTEMQMGPLREQEQIPSKLVVEVAHSTLKRSVVDIARSVSDIVLIPLKMKKPKPVPPYKDILLYPPVPKNLAIWKKILRENPYISSDLQQCGESGDLSSLFTRALKYVKMHVGGSEIDSVIFEELVVSAHPDLKDRGFYYYVAFSLIGTKQRQFVLMENMHASFSGLLAAIGKMMGVTPTLATVPIWVEQFTREAEFPIRVH